MSKRAIAPSSQYSVADKVRKAVVDSDSSFFHPLYHCRFVTYNQRRVFNSYQVPRGCPSSCNLPADCWSFRCLLPYYHSKLCNGLIPATSNGVFFLFSPWPPSSPKFCNPESPDSEVPRMNMKRTVVMAMKTRYGSHILQVRFREDKAGSRWGDGWLWSCLGESTEVSEVVRGLRNEPRTKRHAAGVYQTY